MNLLCIEIQSIETVSSYLLIRELNILGAVTSTISGIAWRISPIVARHKSRRLLNNLFACRYRGHREPILSVTRYELRCCARADIDSREGTNGADWTAA